MASDTYVDTFQARGDLYNEAAEIQPLAREVERGILIDLLRLEPHHTVCDAPAGGGYVADGLRPLLRDPAQIYCVEPSSRFAEAISPDYHAFIAPLHQLPLGDGSVDRVASLAGLHHLAQKQPFFQEAYRVLKPGGLFAVADVLDGTAEARFLNGPVDRYTVTGHQGLFLRPGETSALLRASGFSEVSEEHRSFFWTFHSEEQMVRYCHTLFGLEKATLGEVGAALERYFAVEMTPDGVRLPWSLLYGLGQRG